MLLTLLGVLILSTAVPAARAADGVWVLQGVTRQDMTRPLPQSRPACGGLTNIGVHVGDGGVKVVEDYVACDDPKDSRIQQSGQVVRECAWQSPPQRIAIGEQVSIATTVTRSGDVVGHLYDKEAVVENDMYVDNSLLRGPDIDLAGYIDDPGVAKTRSKTLKWIPPDGASFRASGSHLWIDCYLGDRAHVHFAYDYAFSSAGTAQQPGTSTDIIHTAAVAAGSIIAGVVTALGAMVGAAVSGVTGGSVLSALSGLMQGKWPGDGFAQWKQQGLAAGSQYVETGNIGRFEPPPTGGGGDTGGSGEGGGGSDGDGTTYVSGNWISDQPPPVIDHSPTPDAQTPASAPTEPATEPSSPATATATATEAATPTATTAAAGGEPAISAPPGKEAETAGKTEAGGDDESYLERSIKKSEKLGDRIESAGKAIDKLLKIPGLTDETKETLEHYKEKLEGAHDQVDGFKENLETVQHAGKVLIEGHPFDDQIKDIEQQISPIIHDVTAYNDATKDVVMDQRSRVMTDLVVGGASAAGQYVDSAVVEHLGKTAGGYVNKALPVGEAAHDVGKVMATAVTGVKTSETIARQVFTKEELQSYATDNYVTEQQSQQDAAEVRDARDKLVAEQDAKRAEQDSQDAMDKAARDAERKRREAEDAKMPKGRLRRAWDWFWAADKPQKKE
ncbi:MAG: hypothetical protein P4M07_10010 [Xanthobacteraceae bacterium]|nr:hypothetical protein [Xanthobacteraceae bacterium]